MLWENYRVIEAADAASWPRGTAAARSRSDNSRRDAARRGRHCALPRDKKDVRCSGAFPFRTRRERGCHCALRAGGDDYLPKPYDIRVLLARVEARLRSANKNKRFVSSAAFRLDTVSMIAYSGERDLLLTYKEFAILLMLGRNAGRTVNKEELYENVWGNPIAVTETPCIRRCRDSIKSSAMPGRISRCRTEEISATPSRMCGKNRNAYNYVSFAAFLYFGCIIVSGIPTRSPGFGRSH